MQRTSESDESLKHSVYSECFEATYLVNMLNQIFFLGGIGSEVLGGCRNMKKMYN